ncbi:hypothetical protein [Flavobacterium sp. '19STA2R22 D10 B1']|uniref:hypothetical protein n=1 Tax=Flavobacterium aerium TaxID=3037261 RepID=UPI00278C0358|nr:hypothetical protein [Flavobacterium sp. '19STA2R22 D10 B1']
MNRIIAKIMFWSCVLILNISGCTAQDNVDYSGIHTSLRAFNLHGKVESVRFFYNYKKEGYSKYEILLLKAKNDVASVGYRRFDEYGMMEVYLYDLKDSITQAINYKATTSYVYNEKDRIEKEKYRIKQAVPFPAYNNIAIKLNEKIWDRGTGSEIDPNLVQNVYSYTFDDKNRIIEEIQNQPLDDYEVTPPPAVYIHTRTHYTYDQKGNLISQEINAGENQKNTILGTYYEHYLDTPYNSDIKRNYKYDSQNRLIQITYLINGKKEFEEKYTYDSKENYINQVERYIMEGGNYRAFPAEQMIGKYNRYGDITEQVFTTPGLRNKPAINRYYEYEYDAQHNWITCKLYLEGHKNDPTLIATRIIKYYE